MQLCRAGLIFRRTKCHMSLTAAMKNTIPSKPSIASTAPPIKVNLPTKPNIAVYTNPRHDLWVAETKPSLESLADLTPGPDEALVHVRATGICATDVHVWKDGHIGDLLVPENHILGHESAGEVVKVGANVTNVKPGDRVAIEPGLFCGHCSRCTEGYYNGCKDTQFKSVPPIPGQLVRYMLHPASLLYPMGDVPFEVGALFEPISVGLAAVERAKLEIGQPTVITGAGPIGLVCAMLARANGASPIVITDIDERRLEIAEGLIPHIRTVHVAKGEESHETARKIQEAADGLQMKVAIECSGFESSISAAIYSLDFRGVVVLAGLGENFVNFPFMHVTVNEIDIKPIFKYKNTWPKAIRIVQDGLIDATPLITHRFKLEDAAKAFETFTDKTSGALKIMIKDED